MADYILEQLLLLYALVALAYRYLRSCRCVELLLIFFCWYILYHIFFYNYIT